MKLVLVDLDLCVGLIFGCHFVLPCQKQQLFQAKVSALQVKSVSQALRSDHLPGAGGRNLRASSCHDVPFLSLRWELPVHSG